MKKLWYLLPALAVIAILIFVAAWLIPKPLISKSLKGQITSTVFVPKSPYVKNQIGSAKYDSGLKLLSYNVTAFGANIIVSEQPTPENFIDIPAVYQKVIDSSNEYDTFQVPSGTVYLTKPKDQNGRQVAIMNSQGTLMFVKPSNNLTGDQWRQFFQTLQTQH